MVNSYQCKHKYKEINEWVKLETNDKEENVIGLLISLYHLITENMSLKVK